MAFTYTGLDIIYDHVKYILKTQHAEIPDAEFYRICEQDRYWNASIIPGKSFL